VGSVSRRIASVPEPPDFQWVIRQRTFATFAKIFDVGNSASIVDGARERTANVDLTRFKLTRFKRHGGCAEGEEEEGKEADGHVGEGVVGMHCYWI
jgi:hypothetical protein